VFCRILLLSNTLAYIPLPYQTVLENTRVAKFDDLNVYFMYVYIGGTFVTCCSFTAKNYVQMCVKYHGTQGFNKFSHFLVARAFPEFFLEFFCLLGFVRIEFYLEHENRLSFRCSRTMS